MTSYFTAEKAAFGVLTEKKSRFIGYINPVTSEEEAVSFINMIRGKHSDARHNVYAYLIRQSNKQRYSDDGEPQGTGGMPVLELMQHEQLTDCVIVVTRYFGGILLGTGGLARAYSSAARLAIEAAGIVKMSLCRECELCCDYNQYNIMTSIFSKHGAAITDSIFEENVQLKFYIENDEFEALCIEITEKSSGKVAVLCLGEKYLPLK